MSQFTEAKWQQFEDFREANGLQATWSIYETEDMSAKHPYVGATKVSYINNWGQPAHAVIRGETWGDLFKSAAACIEASLDTHHRFIEAFTVFQSESTTLYLHTGS